MPPTVILLVGLQGSGKTTTAGKLARRLKLEQKAPFLVAADVYRPAAIDQLETLGQQVDVAVYSDAGTKDVVEDRAATASSRRGRRGRGRVIVDTAGRLQIDDEMMDELQAAQGGGLARRDPARRRRHDRPGRGADRARASTTRSASPA